MNDELSKEISNYINSYQEFCEEKGIEAIKELISFLSYQNSTGYDMKY